MMVAASFFLASLTGLALLFTLKALEVRRGRTFLPTIHRYADEFALALKAMMFRTGIMLSRIPPMLVLITRYALHELALGAAKLARVAEAQSHRIADLVSHKRSFEKRADRPQGPRSTFLKQVGDVKNGGHDEREEV